MVQELVDKDTISNQPILAVIPFQVDKNIDPEAGKIVAEIMIPYISASGKYKVVDRGSFQKVIQEQELSHSDLVAGADPIPLGKLLVAQRILVGSISQAFGERLITTKIVDVETGRVISSASTAVKPSEINSAVKEILGEGGRVSSSLFRSMVMPGWGQFYTHHPVRGSLSFATFWGVFATTLYFTFDQSKKQNAWESFKTDNSQTNRVELIRNECGGDAVCATNKNKEIDRKIEDKRTNYEDAFDNMVLFGVITAGVYSLNLVDATLAGFTAKKKFDLYFSYSPQSQKKSLRISRAF